MRKRKTGARAKFGMIIILTILASLLMLLFIESRLRPLIIASAESYARSFAANAAAQAVFEALGPDISPTKIVSGERGVSSVETDINAVNRLRSRAVTILSEKLSSPNRQTFKIPVGNLTGSSLLSGRGFGIKVKLIQVGDVTAETVSKFESAGINQTLHRIYIRLNIKMNILAASKVSGLSVTEDILVSETVIVGEVPSTYVSAGNLRSFSG